jgi:hypothetical protein
VAAEVTFMAADETVLAAAAVVHTLMDPALVRLVMAPVAAPRISLPTVDFVPALAF